MYNGFFHQVLEKLAFPMEKQCFLHCYHLAHRREVSAWVGHVLLELVYNKSYGSYK